MQSHIYIIVPLLESLDECTKWVRVRVMVYKPLSTIFQLYPFIW